MSYCRWGADSDVYVYGSEREVKGTTERVWVCMECTLYADNPAVGEGDVYAPYLRGLRAHLEEHRLRGDKVPDYAFERIDKEMAEGIE